jgi:hypothetical protein
MTASGMLALMGESTCFSHGLQYTLQVVALDEKQETLVYKKTIKMAQKHHVPEAGYQLARRVLKGPKLPKVKPKEDALVHWGVALGMVKPHQEKYAGYGTSFGVNRFTYISERTDLELKVGLHGLSFQESGFELSTINLDLGLKYSPLADGLDLWLSAGIMGSYRYWFMIERDVNPIDSQELLWSSGDRQTEGQGFGVAPWIEAGWIWSVGQLQPYLASRYVPFGLPSGQDWAEVSLLFGLRWR